MKTWVKLYTEVNEDPKIGSLTWAQRGIWSALLALAGRLDYRDENDKETGLLDTPQNTAWHLRCPAEEFGDALKAFQERGMIDEREGLLYITNYAKRQARPPSASREAVAKRVKRHREAKPDQRNEETDERNESVTPLQNNVTPLETDTELDTELDTEQRQNRTDNAPSAGAGAPTSPPDIPPPRKSSPRDPKSKLTSGQREFLALFGAKRFKTNAARDTILRLEQEFGTGKLLAAAEWAAKKQMTVGNAVVSIEKALPNWNNNNGRNKHKQNRPNTARPETPRAEDIQAQAVRRALQ